MLDGNKEAEKLNELQALKERISDLQKHHSDDLERLYESQAQDYLQEARDRYVAKDDTQYLVKGENNSTAKASYGRLDVRTAQECCIASGVHAVFARACTKKHDDLFHPHWNGTTQWIDSVLIT
jgi:hypothetical protein